MLLALQTSCLLYQDSAYLPGSCVLAGENASFSHALHLQRPAKQTFQIMGKTLCYFSFFDFSDATVDELHLHLLVGDLRKEEVGCDASVFSLFSNFENAHIKNLTITGSAAREFKLALSFQGSANVYLVAGANVSTGSFEGLVVENIYFRGFSGFLDGKNVELGVQDATGNQYLLYCKDAFGHLRVGFRVKNCYIAQDHGCNLSYYGVCVDACPQHSFQLGSDCVVSVPEGHRLAGGSLVSCDAVEYLNYCYDAQPTPTFLLGVYHCYNLQILDSENEKCVSCASGLALVNNTCVSPSTSACKVYPVDFSYCSQKCDEFYYQDGKKCVESCGSQYQNVDSRVCGSCAEGMFKDEVAKKCVFICPGYARAGLCVADCNVGEEKFEANKTCIDCKAQNMVWLDWKCVSACGNLFNDSFVCSERCVSGIYKTQNAQKICYASCNQYLLERSDGQRECVAYCEYFTGTAPNQICQSEACNKFAELVQQKPNPSYRCLESCDKFVLPSTQGFQLCVAQCQGEYPYYKPSKVCVATCQPLFVDNGQCVESCPFFTQVDGEKKCQQECDKFYVDNVGKTNRECLSECPVGAKYANGHVCKTYCDPETKYNDSFICKGSCGDKFSASDVNFSCISSCSSGIYQFVGSEKHCLDQCDLLLNSTEIGDSCVSVCPKEQNYVFDGRCKFVCPESHSFMQQDGLHFLCQDNCEYFASSVGNLTCTERCDAYFQREDGQAYCTNGCTSVSNPTSIFGQHLSECLERCPETGNYVNDSTICRPECQTLEYQDGIICKNTCGDRFVGNQQDKVCVDGCADYVSNETLDGERVCVEGCSALTYIDNGVKYCSSTCGNRFLSSDKKSCVEGCGTDFERIDPINGSKTCTTTCSMYVEVVGNRLLCVDACNLYFYRSVAVIGRNESLNKCVATCTTDGFKFVDGNETQNGARECLSACESPLLKLVVGLETMCIDRCPPETQFINASYCNETCASTFFEELERGKYECVVKCASFYLYVGSLGANYCLAECPESHPYNLTHQCLEACPAETYNLNRIIAGDQRNLTCVTSCFYENAFVQGLFSERGFLNCSSSCSDNIFKNYTLLEESTETVCIPAGDCEKMLYTHMDESSYLFNTTECRDGCIDPYRFNDSNNCVLSCPSNKSLLDNVTCLSECPFYNDNAGGCVVSCPDGPFYNYLERSPFVFRNCTAECPDNYAKDSRFENASHYQCIPGCNATFPLLEGQQCVYGCENLTYNNSLICEDRCPWFSNFTDAFHATCYIMCDHFFQNRTNVINPSVVDMVCLSQCSTAVFNYVFSVNGEQITMKYCTEINCSSLDAALDAYYEQGGYCVAKCTDPTRYNDSFLCVSSCRGREPNRFLKNSSSTECTSYCPKYANRTIVAGEDTCVDECVFVDLDSFCVDQCDTLFVQDGNYCRNKCGAEFGYLEERQCKAACSRVGENSFINVTAADNKTCLASCEHFYEERGDGAYCLEECAGFHFRNAKGVQCVPECPPEKQYHLADRSCVAECPDNVSFVGQQKNCVADCDSPWAKSGRAKVCVSSCDVLEVNFSRECVSACPDESLYQFEGKCYAQCFGTHIYNSSYVCLDSCGEQYVADQSNLTCVTACPSLSYEEVGSEKICRQQCDSVYLQRSGHKMCLNECPDDFKYNDSFQCLAECSDALRYHYNLVCQATCGEIYYESSTSTQCVLTCSSGFFQRDVDSQHRTCVPECGLFVPGAENSLNECFSACPVEFPLKFDRFCVQNCASPKPFNDSFECSASCGSRFSLEGTCVDACPAYWVSRATEGGVSVRFCVAACNAYLHGSQECRDECFESEVFNGRYCVQRDEIDGSQNDWDDIGVCGE